MLMCNFLQIKYTINLLERINIKIQKLALLFSSIVNSAIIDSHWRVRASETAELLFRPLKRES